MKKITVNKSDEAAMVVEKIIEVDSRDVILSIPRFSHLAESLSNFHLLKREASALNKRILIESVDDRVIELAGLSGLKAVNPFFSKNKRQFSDIVAPQAKGNDHESRAGHRPRAGGIEIVEKHHESKKRLSFQFLKSFKPVNLLKLFGFLKLPKLSKLPQTPWKTLVIIVLVFLVLWVAVQKLPRANVELVAKKADWAYNDSIMTTKSAKTDSRDLTVPNQTFTQKKNIELKFPATGKKQVEINATGKIIVYNAYSSEPQPLVEKTRLLTPEGKLYRLTERITVPAAKIIEGQIVPSSIETNVIADKAGTDYNIGPVKLFNIPGFKGTPKYQGFYAESKESMAGGFIGEVAYPTSGDISSAKVEVAKSLEDGLGTAIYSQMPAGFKILKDAVKFTVLKYSVSDEADADAKFSVFGEATMTVIGFKEEDVLGVLSKRAGEEVGPDYKVQTTELEYGLARADFETGKMSFLVNFKAHLSHLIDAEGFKSRIIGRSETDLRAIIYSLPGVEGATISLWPFWVSEVPTDPDRVKITID